MYGRLARFRPVNIAAWCLIGLFTAAYMGDHLPIKTRALSFDGNTALDERTSRLIYTQVTGLASTPDVTILRAGRSGAKEVNLVTILHTDGTAEWIKCSASQRTVQRLLARSKFQVNGESKASAAELKFLSPPDWWLSEPGDSSWREYQTLVGIKPTTQRYLYVSRDRKSFYECESTAMD